MRDISTTRNLTPAEAAERLTVSVGTLANWRSAGRGPDYRKFGSRVAYPLAAIEEFEVRALVKAISA